MRLPIDENQNPVPLTQSSTALARTVSSSISGATSITLNTSTTLLEITAADQGVYLRYQAGVTAANFDEYIHADTTRHYKVPYGVTVVSVIERSATATVIVIEK